MNDYPVDIRDLLTQFDVAEEDARALISNLDDDAGSWRLKADSWSIAECLDHLAIANWVYLLAMEDGASRARANRQMRTKPANPGFVGWLFVKSLEPPVGRRLGAPRAILPVAAVRLSDAFTSFIASQQKVREFLRANAGLELAEARFKNPFVRGIRFSLATGLHVIAAHERRHLWQARKIRESMRAAVRTSESS